MNKVFKRYMTFALATLMVISSVIPASAASIQSSKSTSVTIKQFERNHILKDQTGNAIGGSYWQYTTNKEGVVGPAYCIAHGLKAVADSVSLPLKPRYEASPKTLGAFANGYPQVTLADFRIKHNLSGLTESEYGYATQLAIWASLGQLSVEGTQFTAGSQKVQNPTSSGDAQQIRVYKAIQAILAGAATWTKNQWRGMYLRYDERTMGNILELYNADGLAGLAMDNSEVSLETIEGTDYYTVTFYASSATPTTPNGNFIDVEPRGPAGTILVDADTNEPLATIETDKGNTAYRVPTSFAKTDINSNGVEYVGKFKIAIPAENAAPSGNVDLYSNADITQYEVYIAHNDNKSQQSYMVADPAVGHVGNYGIFRWSSDEAEEGALQITKIDGSGWPLEGATFELRGSSGYSESRTTGDDGLAIWESLDPSDSFTVFETVAPAGYAPREPMAISISANITTYATVRNDNAPKLFLKKIDQQNNRVLEGAVFELEQIDGSFKTSGVTQFDGVLALGSPDLPFGSYEVKEISAPEGYLKDTKVQTVHWDGSKDVTLTFTNVRLPGITVVKTSESGEPLADAVFDVFKDGQFINSVTTDFAGIAHFYLTESGEGYYEFEEISAPDGYVLDSTKHGIYFDPYDPAVQDDPTVIVVNKAKPYLQIVKVDANTGAPIEGCTFEVYKDTQLVGSYVTDGDGEILINVDPGVYLAKEVGVPEGYVLNPYPQEIRVLAGDGIKTLIFLNNPKPGVYILKVDEATGEFLANAEFSVEKNGGQIVYQGLTNSTGMIYVENLDPGWYSIKELAAPDGYLKRDEEKNILLEEGKFVQVKFDNRRCPSLEILKLDGVTKQPLPGAIFKVAKTEDKTVSEYITGADGKVLIQNLDESVYSVEEMSAPSGYILNPQPKEIALEWGKTKTLIYEDVRKPTLIVTKTNALTYEPVPDTTYRIELEKSGGVTTVGTYRTDANGQIIIKNAEPGWYVITETIPAPGFSLPSNPTTRKYLTPGENAYTNFDRTGESGDTSGDNILVTDGDEYTLGHEIINYPLNSIVIRKADATTGELLSGAVFELRKVSEDISGSSGTLIGRYTTGSSGTIVISGLEPGGYIVEEAKAPTNYLLSENAMQQVWLRADGTSIVEATFGNWPHGGILITKVDALTNEPLANAHFRVVDSSGAVVGNTNGEYITDENGEIMIPNVRPGSYVITETKAPDYYTIDTTPQTILVGMDGKVYKVSFKNQPHGRLTILKYDTATREPLAGAEFKVTDSTGAVVGTGNGKYTTDATGQISIPSLPKGSYVIQETKAPDGYVLENQQQTISVDYGKTYTLEFFNSPMSGAQIIKIDSVTKQPLKDAKFTLYRMDGGIVGTYETNGDGVIILDALSPGWYKAAETAAPDGYIMDDTPKDFEITSNQFVKLVFENKPLASLNIKKIDERSGTPLSGAEFHVRLQNGAHVGDYTTGADGMISLPNAAPGWYVITEAKAPEGYILDQTPKTVEVKAAVPTVVTFTNKALAGLQIIKLNSVTRQPVEGAEFAIAKMDGERVGTYRTNVSGIITIAQLEPGWYTVSEVKAADGYILDATPQNVEIKWGKSVTMEITNTPASGLLIIKTDESTGKPIAGVRFEVKKANGEQVGIFTTDQSGRIYVHEIAAGKYVVIETAAASGYVLDSKAHEVTIYDGKQATLEVKNKQLGGLRLIKTDSITKKPIYNVEFMVFDQSNKVVGTYYTDNKGVIDFTGVLPEGRYSIRETRAANGYYLDEIPKTVEFKSGKVTEVRWENIPKMAQIQIIKKSGDDNEVNGFAAGAPLSGAVFEAYEYKTGNLVDRFVSGSDGRAISAPLPLGRYIVKEVQAPQWYKLSDKTLDIELEFATQIVKAEFYNYSANTGVYIKKSGNLEAMPGDMISYTIKAVQNTSTVQLTDFYWRDTLPTNAVRLNKIVTGTYNQSLKYKVLATTNKGDTKIIADNLSTTKNNVIDCSNASLGLYSDEYVTSVTFMFGTVKAGFMQVQQPQIFTKVLSSLPNRYQFSNKADVGGKYGNEWVVSNSTWLTTIYTKPVKLPRTGY